MIQCGNVDKRRFPAVCSIANGRLHHHLGNADFGLKGDSVEYMEVRARSLRAKDTTIVLIEVEA